MGEKLVPMVRTEWNFFQRQRMTFSSMVKGVEQELSEFDKELDRIRKDMFQLTAPDFKNPESMMLKVDHPIVEDAQGHKRLSLRFDCKDYKPEEIVVSTADNRLVVKAKHVEESPGRKISREFSRQYVLPSVIDPDSLNSTLSSDGVLSIEGPAPEGCQASKERLLPITDLSKA